MIRKRRLTENDVVCRAVQADIAWWVRVNTRCPTCCLKLAELPKGDTLYRHMVGDCERNEMFVGINWVRQGRNVDAPLADAADRREVKVLRPKRPIQISLKMLVWAGVAFAVGVGLLLCALSNWLSAVNW